MKKAKVWAAGRSMRIPKGNSRGSTKKPIWLAESPSVLGSRAPLKPAVDEFLALSVTYMEYMSRSFKFV